MKYDVIEKDNEIVIKKNSEHTFEIHLGFLQLNHKYSVSLSIPRNECNSLNNSLSTPVCLESGNQHLNILNAAGTGDILLFSLELFAYKEQLMNQEFSFKLSDQNDKFTVIMKSRVLGKP